MTPHLWTCRSHTFDLRLRPLVLGIVNVTPDSFSDGGQFFDATTAIAHGLKLAADGADILDIGGESTRPGATPVSLDEELRRVIPVIRALAAQTPVPISIDTMKADVARQAIDVGACIVNDVTGLRRDPAMIDACASSGAGVIVMHMQGDPATMHLNPHYANVVTAVDEFFGERLASLTAAGIPAESLCFDPGIGFGKTNAHSLSLLANLKTFQRHGRPLCLGVSRKGVIGNITGRERADRLAGTLAVNCFAVATGAAQVLRVHDVAATRDAAKMWAAIHADPQKGEPQIGEPPA